MGKILIFLLLLVFRFSGASEIALSNTREFFLINGEVKDFRVDTNSDGKTDIWKTKIDGVDVVSVFKANKKILNIQDSRGEKVVEVVAEEKNGRLSVTSLKSSPKENYIRSCSRCPAPPVTLEECRKAVDDRLKSFSADLNESILKGKASKLWANSCSDIPGFEEVKGEIQKGFIRTLKIDGGRKNSLIECLEKAEKSAVSPVKDEISLWLLQAKVTISEFYQDKLPNDTFSCAKGSEDKILSNSTSEKILINFKDGSSFSSPDGLKQHFFSSMLSSFGVNKDKSSAISELCLKEDFDNANRLLVSSVKVSKGPATTLTHIALAVESGIQSADAIPATIASKSELAGINKKLAETKVNIPSAEETSPMAIAAIERTQGPEAAQRVARTQSSNLMGAANTVLGAVSSPAVASSRSLASDTSSSTKRESIKFGDSVVGKRAPASNLKARGIASDERIVEEIDLTKRSQGTSTTARSSNANKSRLPASAGANGSSVEATALSNEGGQELGSMGASGSTGTAPTGGGSRGSLLSESSSPVGQQTQARSASRSGGATASPAREEVVSYFRNADYTQARRKLRDPNFIKILKDNSITVMDLAGNSFGATRGSTIFLDQGDRFVRQK